MQKPTPQFISKLEEELRLAYRSQYRANKAGAPLRSLFRIVVPVFSGALVLALVWMNYGTNILPAITGTGTQTASESGDERFVAFNEGTEEEQVAQNFDNDELNQIDLKVQQVASGQF